MQVNSGRTQSRPIPSPSSWSIVDAEHKTDEIGDNFGQIRRPKQGAPHGYPTLPEATGVVETTVAPRIVPKGFGRERLFFTATRNVRELSSRPAARNHMDETRNSRAILCFTGGNLPENTIHTSCLLPLSLNASAANPPTRQRIVRIARIFPLVSLSETPANPSEEAWRRHSQPGTPRGSPFESVAGTQEHTGGEQSIRSRPATARSYGTISLGLALSGPAGHCPVGQTAVEWSTTFGTLIDGGQGRIRCRERSDFSDTARHHHRIRAHSLPRSRASTNLGLEVDVRRMDSPVRCTGTELSGVEATRTAQRIGTRRLRGGQPPKHFLFSLLSLGCSYRPKYPEASSVGPPPDMNALREQPHNQRKRRALLNGGGWAALRSPAQCHCIASI